jgi:UDP-N-acetylmuramoyl-L-alanyl-D-glutamate--2,6-diaminopimelate ligase
MKLLKDILYRCAIVEVHGTTNVAIDSLTSDSRKIEQFSLFIAIKGGASDGHQFIDKVIENGAIAIVCETLPEILNEKVTYIKVKDSRVALSYIACNYYDNPSEKLKLIGVTGTNGKTTTTTLLFNLFSKLGYNCGLLSTVRNKIINEEITATHTTPDPLQLNKLLALMVERGCTHAFMEVSSHALEQHRVTGIHFSGGLFTNITHDHLDYHKTFDNYIAAKKKLFDMLPADAFALVNKDDRNGMVMVQNCKAKIKTYALKSSADFKAKIIENHFSGLYLNIDGTDVWTKLIGSFNAYNLLTVYSAAIMLKEEKINVLSVLSSLDSVDGRFEYTRSENGLIGIVDYAHTPDALENVLTTINDIRTGNEQVITLVGCGGDRDTSKRPEMARIACVHSDKVILTSDNPRSEDPNEILTQMQKGITGDLAKKYISVTDRKEAIRTAVMLAKRGDIILIAGKGHEKYQEIKGVRTPFDDMEIYKEMLQLLGK